MKIYNNNQQYTLTGKELEQLQFDAIKDWMEQRRQELRDNIYDGDRNCPICKNKIKAHKLELTKSMINSLYSLYCLNEISPGIYHKDKIQSHFHLQSNVIGKLKHWKLVEQHSGGKYSITSQGQLFILDKIKVQSYQWIYKDKRIRPNDTVPEISISQLITKFNIKYMKL